MDAEVTLFTKPEELVAWLDDNDILMGIGVEDAQILLNYMEGHDYAIGTDAAGKMIRKDIAEDKGEIDEYSIDEVIDIVCEWNYELILDADMRRNNPDNFIDFVNAQNRYERLKEEEKKLDIMFDKTKYGKECEELGKRLADEFIARLNQNKDISECVATVSEGIQQYHTGNRGR